MTNAAFNWAVVIGDVVRVVLLFYLMPLWTVLLARVVLGERLTRRGGAARRARRWPARRSSSGRPARRRGGRAPAPRCCRCRARSPTGSASLGGFSFAFNNVMLRREAGRPEEGRALAMFVGGALVAGALAVGPDASGAAPAPPAPALAVAGADGRRSRVVFLAGNLSLQYGAARLPANRTAVVMLTEVRVRVGCRRSPSAAAR